MKLYFVRQKATGHVMTETGWAPDGGLLTLLVSGNYSVPEGAELVEFIPKDFTEDFKWSTIRLWPVNKSR